MTARDASPHDAAARAVEWAARTSYGRLVAIVASRTRDIAAAEDALGDAFAAALAQWPTSGVPDNPDAWLVATARRRLADGRRRVAVRERAADAIRYAAEAVENVHPDSSGGLPDRRVDLLFACAHPAIDATLHTPLMLQAVLGLDAAVVARAFLASPAAMAQRLVRAKAKLRDAGVRFAVPEPEERASRVAAVLEAVYAAFGTAWSALDGADEHVDLAEEAIWLGRVLAAALPDDPEALGLLALMLYCHARRGARHDASGAYVPLDRQRAADWDAGMIAEAESLLMRAASLLRPGRFQTEAAIQSAHLAPAYGRPIDWHAIVALYDALLGFAPTVAAQVARVAAVGAAHGADAGLAAADRLDGAAVATYQPWWALRAHLLAARGHVPAAREAYARAAGLTEGEAARAFLLDRMRALPADSSGGPAH